MAVSHVHLLVYMNSCFTCTSVADFRDHKSVTTYLVSSQNLWTTKYHHTSCIITNSIWNLQYHHTLFSQRLCVDHNISPHIQYHYKLLYVLYSITTHQVSSQSLCMDHPVTPQHTATVTHHCVCCKCIPSLPAFKLLNLRTVKCHCPVAIMVAMITVMTYGK